MMHKSKVIEILGIATLDIELIDNVLELCGVLPILGSNILYNGEEVCRLCAKAAVFFKEYLPEYYVSELLGISVDELLKMNIEYIKLPIEMQCLFYDSYQSGEFRYSKYSYNAIQVYKMLDVLSKSVYLEVPEVFAQQFKSYFISAEVAAVTLGFCKINPSLYHYYLMLLDIKYAWFNESKFYLTDDIINVSEKATKILTNYIAFNEAREKYGYHILRYLCNKYSFHPYKDDFVKYDVVFSDMRYDYEYCDSYTFISRNEIKKAYFDWFNNSICKNIKEVIDVNKSDYKVVCDRQPYGSDYDLDYDLDYSSNNISMSVFDQEIYWHTGITKYERDPEFEQKSLLCKIYEIDISSKREKFDKILRAQKISRLILPEELCNVSAFAQEFEKAVFFNLIKENNITNQDSIEYNAKSNCKDTLCFFIQKVLVMSMLKKIYIYQNNVKYVHKEILKFWNNIDSINYEINDYIHYENSIYVSYNAYKLNCLKQYYSSKLFKLYSGELDGIPGGRINSNAYSLRTNEYLQDLLYNDYYKAFILKEHFKQQLVFVQRRNSSTINMCEVLDKSVEFWTFDKVILYLDINKYNFTLIWSILYYLELSMFYYRENLYFNVQEIRKLKTCVSDLLNEYMSVKNLYQFLHGTPPIIKLTDEIVAPSIMFYFLMPENYRGFYFIKKISLELLDEVYNERVNCDSFLTEAEIKSDLTILPTKIISSLASILLDIESYWLNELNQNHSLYADNSILFCKRDTVIKLIEQQKYHKETFILEDKIREFLKLEIDKFTETDRDVLKTINVYNAPDYITHMSENKGIVNNRAYRKEDVISIKEFLHVSRNTQYDVKVDNDISSKYPYQTYLMRLEPLGLISTLEQISLPSAEIWDKFVRLQLMLQHCSEKTINNKINQYIKTLNILINFLQVAEISEFSNLQTGILNRWLKNINSVTYTKILIGFFKFAAIEYISQGIKIKYRYKELKPPINAKSKLDDVLPEIYSFTEYSKLFNYCNDYYTHIEIAVNEILDNGTCTYASTWFYVMSHLNNAWRSNDFSMFPYIDILDVINRSTNDDAKWFLNNRMTRSDATIIALRIQNNPKVISKTKKYTRFVCSDELLETYTTVYSLLAFYTIEYLSIETGFVNHFENKYNGVNKSQLNYFFLNFGTYNFRFKSRKMNKTLLSMIDFLENFYVNNDVDTERRQAMLLRSHVEPTTTAHYIQKTKEVFDRITNMICARGEFGYAYEMIVKSVIDVENKLSPEDMTDKIREIRYMLPNMKDMDILYGFLNYTHKEQAEINEYINALPLDELQTMLTKLYLNHLGSKADRNLSCFNSSCQKSHGRNDECTYCILHIPTIYTLTIICQSAQDDILCCQYATSEITRKKIIDRIIKKSRDILWGRQKYGDDVIREVLAISGADYDQFLLLLNNFLVTQKQLDQIVGDKKDA